jgi:hypothetical protein
MKKLLMLIVLMGTLFAGTIYAATVNLAWDAMPSGQQWTEVRCYERIGASAPYTYTLKGTVAGTPPTNAISITGVATGTHTYVVRAYNGQSESVDSNSVQGVILAVPNMPTTITITIQVP